MARVKRGVTARARRKKIILSAKGYRGRSKNCYKTAKDSVEKALQYSYRDRRVRKRDFRALWNQRINAAARMDGLTYSEFIAGIKVMSVKETLSFEVNRKILADMAVNSPDVFSSIAKKVKSNYYVGNRFEKGSAVAA
jgi:large subunit ribosomal protein L20